MTLYDEYYENISGWNWHDIVGSARDNVQETDEGEFTGSYYLGSCLTLSPSGKYYTPFACSNVNKREAYRDEQWYKALDKIASDHNGWIENGEGDPLDLYFCIDIHIEE